MGTQQLLLLVLGAVIVGVAIVAGLNMASSGAEQAEREGANVEAQAIGASATDYSRKPLTMGGGQGSFASTADSMDLDLSSTYATGGAWTWNSNSTTDTIYLDIATIEGQSGQAAISTAGAVVTW